MRQEAPGDTEEPQAGGLEKGCGKASHERLPGLAHSKTRDRLDPDAVIGEI